MGWLSALGALTGFLGGQGQQQKSSQADEMAARNNQRIIDYILNKREKTLDPIEQKTIIPRLRGRAEQPQWYAGDWLKQARGLRAPMKLEY